MHNKSSSQKRPGSVCNQEAAHLNHNIETVPESYLYTCTARLTAVQKQHSTLVRPNCQKRQIYLLYCRKKEETREAADSRPSREDAKQTDQCSVFCWLRDVCDHPIATITVSPTGFGPHHPDCSDSVVQQLQGTDCLNPSASLYQVIVDMLDE